MRQRTKYNYTQEEYKELYQGYDTNKWYDHIYRVAISSIILQEAVKRNGIKTLADLSAGDGMVTRDVPVEKYLGDFSRENCVKGRFQFCGPIEETISWIPPVDLFILSETLEHVEDPDRVLRDISVRANWLFLTTPLDETLDINPEHLWVWDKGDIQAMLYDVGFNRLEIYSELEFGVSRFQLWLVTK